MDPNFGQPYPGDTYRQNDWNTVTNDNFKDNRNISADRHGMPIGYQQYNGHQNEPPFAQKTNFIGHSSESLNFRPPSSQNPNFRPPPSPNFRPLPHPSPNFRPAPPQNPNFTPVPPQNPNFRPPPHPSPNFRPALPQNPNFIPVSPQNQHFRPPPPPSPNYRPPPHPSQNFRPAPPQNPNFTPVSPQNQHFRPPPPPSANFRPPPHPSPNFRPAQPPSPNFRPALPQNPNFTPVPPQNPNFRPPPHPSPNFRPPQPPSSNPRPAPPQNSNFTPVSPQNQHFTPPPPPISNFRPAPPQNPNLRPPPPQNPSLRPPPPPSPNFKPPHPSSSPSFNPFLPPSQSPHIFKIPPVPQNSNYTQRPPLKSPNCNQTAPRPQSSSIPFEFPRPRSHIKTVSTRKFNPQEKSRNTIDLHQQIGLLKEECEEKTSDVLDDEVGLFLQKNEKYIAINKGAVQKTLDDDISNFILENSKYIFNKLPQTSQIARSPSPDHQYTLPRTRSPSQSRHSSSSVSPTKFIPQSPDVYNKIDSSRSPSSGNCKLLDVSSVNFRGEPSKHANSNHLGRRFSRNTSPSPSRTLIRSCELSKRTLSRSPSRDLPKKRITEGKDSLRRKSKSPENLGSRRFSRNTSPSRTLIRSCELSKRTLSRSPGRDLPKKRNTEGKDNSRRKSKSPEKLCSTRSRRSDGRRSDECTERDMLLENWTKDYCANPAEIKEKLDKLSKVAPEELVKKESEWWTRDSPAERFYSTSTSEPGNNVSTAKLNGLCDTFYDSLILRSKRERANLPTHEPPLRKKKVSKHRREPCCSAGKSDSSSSSDEEEEDCTMEELERKRKHPLRLHPELWFNDVGEMNDGPLCRCSAKARRSGIRHNIYAGEQKLPQCTIDSNNATKLHHYRITISPPTNFLIKTPTIIPFDNHEYIFEGFSMFSHSRLYKLPVCKVIRFNIEYTILYIEEKMPENYTIRELDLFYEYLFKEILELVDLDLKAAGDGDANRCCQFHFMPRFVRELPEHGKEILSMNEVLTYLLNNSDELVKESDIKKIQGLEQYQWQRHVDTIKGMVVTIPGMKPCSLRVDQLDRDVVAGATSLFPEIVHFGIRPPQLSYAGNPDYQKAWREYVKFRHLLANMPKPSFEDKRKLEVKENKLQEMRTQSKMKRDVTITVNSKGFRKTGIMCDIVQHAMLIPVLVSHLRFHSSLDVLEDAIKYKFENRFLLQLALTHPSYRENFGTNPDHARNSLTNCGIRQPEYGDRRIHYMNTRKRGINTLINIMSRFGKKSASESNITHNERLEFLGDAVVEFITSIHLFHMFPDLEEGGLATYRAAIVQNQHLAELAKILKLDEYMLYAHGSDLCHDLELRHAMANCFEALMGALFLDGGIKVADQVFGETLFKGDNDLLDVWVDYPAHPLQDQEPLGDRRWISKYKVLQKLTNFEESIGVEFTHIRLFARAFTDRSIGFTHLTLGSNQRLEFLGDTVLQLIASEYLYKYFPEHHEGHLSLLRSSLVNNRTQAVVCDDLGMAAYALYANPKAELKTKDRADLLEAFLGALYVDKGLDYCEVFCNVCFFPRLETFIMRQDWNDPKSKLQQCCLTLRTMEGGEPEIPVYKVIECMGPTNTRLYTVAVYFKGKRLAKASGHSIQQAEMNAAKKALTMSQNLFPQLDHQKRVISKSLKSQKPLQVESHAPHKKPRRSRRSRNEKRSVQTKCSL